jgi:hypothetical protein
MPDGAAAPELGPESPATLSIVPLEGGRKAVIFEIPREAVDVPPAFTHLEEVFPLTSDVTCFGCTEDDRAVLAGQIGEPKAADQDPNDVHPLSPITLVISDSRVFPNPFNPFVDDAEISITLSEAAQLQITAYDWNGDYVATVFKGDWPVGESRTKWSGQTQDGRKLGNGVYFLRVLAKSGTRQEEQLLKVAVWNER